METVLVWWWVIVMLSVPALPYFAGGRLTEHWTRRGWLWSTLVALGAIGLAWTPVSFAGVVADHLLLGTSVLVLVAACSAWAGDRARTAMSAGLPALLILVSIFGVFLAGLAFALSIRLPNRTVALPCNREARLTNAAMAWTSDLTDIVILHQPVGPLIEVKQARQRVRVAPENLSVRAPTTGSCGVSFVVIRAGVSATVTGEEVWRVP